MEPLDKPIANGANGTRDAHGRFVKGNPGGPGNPYARRVAHLRALFLHALEREGAFEDIVGAIVAQAKKGDVAAAKLVLSYAIGLPRAQVGQEPLDYRCGKDFVRREKEDYHFGRCELVKGHAGPCDDLGAHDD